MRDRYQKALQQIPPPGSGCHTTIFGVANLGVMAGVDTEQIFQDIRANIPHGNRPIPDREITDAINKAMFQHNSGSFTPRQRPKPGVKDRRAALQNIIGQAKITDDAGLRKCSPVPLPDEPQANPVLLIETLFKPDDRLWIADRHKAGIIDETIKLSDDWTRHFRNGGATAPHIIINPLNGIPVMKKSGDGETLRGDGNVASYRYCLVEFDLSLIHI